MFKQKILLATNNAGKIREIQAILPNYEIIPQVEVVQAEAEETGLTFIENAILKARHAAQHCDLPVLADDSGLAVDALNGAPGIFSARYAGIGATDHANNEKLLQELKDIPETQRTARFICVLALLRHSEDPVPLIAQGSWEGRILFEPKGNNGFGYDPLFYVPEHGCSSAELPPEIKNTISHRGQALRKLTALLNVDRTFIPIALDESLRECLKEIFALLATHKKYPYLLADDLLNDEIKALTFLVSNDLWGGMGSIADQPFVGNSVERAQLEKLLIKLGRRQISLGWVNPRTLSWVEAFEKWQTMGLR